MRKSIYVLLSLLVAFQLYSFDRLAQLEEEMRSVERASASIEKADSQRLKALREDIRNTAALVQELTQSQTTGSLAEKHSGSTEPFVVYQLSVNEYLTAYSNMLKELALTATEKDRDSPEKIARLNTLIREMEQKRKAMQEAFKDYNTTVD